jgi:hypothetical protein
MTVNVDFIIIIITVAIQANFKKQFSFFCTETTIRQHFDQN